VQQRSALGTDASEADASVLEWQLRHVEPVTAPEGLHEIVVNTAADIDSGGLAELARRCAR
jgi:hypothetical protein